MVASHNLKVEKINDSFSLDTLEMHDIKYEYDNKRSL